MISKKLVDAFNEQINKELYSEYLYLSMAAWFDAENLPGFANFFKVQVQEERFLRIPTSQLNRLVRDAQSAHAPPSKAGKRLKIFYATQVRTDPPTFLFHVNDPRIVHFSYTRFLENRIRDRFGFLGTPLRISFRPHSEPR